MGRCSCYLMDRISASKKKKIVLLIKKQIDFSGWVTLAGYRRLCLKLTNTALKPHLIRDEYNNNNFKFVFQREYIIKNMYEYTTRIPPT